MTHKRERMKQRPNTRRRSRDWQVRYRRRPTPTTPLNYTNMRSRHSRRHSKTDGPPPPQKNTTHTPRTESASTYGPAEIPSPEATPSHKIQYPDTPHPLTPETSHTTVQTQKHSSPMWLNMITAIDVVCPRCHKADFVYFRCTTCKYFVIHQPDTPDMVPRRLHGVMSPDTLYPRQGSQQGAEPSPTTHTYSGSQPQAATPQPTTPNNTNGWVHHVTKDGDVETNPGPASPRPSAKRIRYNRDTPPTYNTLKMLHKHSTDTPMLTEHKRRHTGDVEIVYQEHHTQARECTPPQTQRRGHTRPPISDKAANQRDSPE